MQITDGIFPLKLNYGAHGQELQRAFLLIETLAKHWRGTTKFNLHIVCLNEEVHVARSALSDRGSTEVSIHVYPESDFFPPGSVFYDTHPTYKQQLLKMWAPRHMGFGPFLTLDADVVCLKDFDGSTFVSEDRLISTWEPKRAHSWWENGMSGCGLTTNLDTPGFGVTPNILHADLCREIFIFMERRGFDPLGHLCALTKHHPNLISYESERGHPLVWSEYSLYTMIAEASGKLFDYHVSPERVEHLGIRLHSRRNVWGAGFIDRLRPDPGDSGYFLVVQSWAGVPVETILPRLAPDTAI